MVGAENKRGEKKRKDGRLKYCFITLAWLSFSHAGPREGLREPGRREPVYARRVPPAAPRPALPPPRQQPRSCLRSAQRVNPAPNQLQIKLLYGEACGLKPGSGKLTDSLDN